MKGCDFFKGNTQILKEKKEMKEIKENQIDSKSNRITMHVPPREKEDAEMNRMLRCDNDY